MNIIDDITSIYSANRYVNSISDGLISLVQPSVPRQLDTAHDCGVHVMLMALSILKNKEVRNTTFIGPTYMLNLPA